MMIRWLRFNTYFALSLALALPLCSGCRSLEGQRKKVLSALRVYLEVPAGTPNAGEPVPIYRERPIMVRVEKSPCLTESHTRSAKVIDIVGGFALSIQFNRQGTWLFEQYTIGNHGRRFAVAAQWMTPPEKILNTPRWLAAPKLTANITDGQFIFTPDATRDEAELIARGLNNLAKKTGSDDKW